MAEASSSSAAIAAAPPLPNWRVDEIASLTGRLRAVPVQGGKTAVSSDAPTDFHLGAGATIARARPLADAATSAAGRINRGVLRGAGISPPRGAPQHPKARQTIVLVDIANPGRRWRDPDTLESRHRAEAVAAAAAASAAAAAAATGPREQPAASAGGAAGAHADSSVAAAAGFAAALRPRSSGFLSRNGGATRYLHSAVSNRAVTPALSSHQRLSSLEDSLAQSGTQLWSTGPAGYVRGSAAEASSGQSGWSAAADDDALNDGRWPMPSRPPSGYGHSGLPRTSTAGQGYAFTTGLVARRPATARFSALDRDAAPLELAGGLGAGSVIDLSATRAVGWAPGAPAPAVAAAHSASAAAVAAATATAPQRERAPATLFDLPPPLPMLRSKADAETFLSRASRAAVNPRTRASRLDASLGALVAANAAAAAHLMGHPLAGSQLGLAGTAAAIAAASVRLPSSAGAANAAFSSSQTLQQQMLDGGNSGVQHDQQHQHGGGGGGDLDEIYPSASAAGSGSSALGGAAPTTYGSSGRGQSVGGGFRSVLGGVAGPSSGANDVPRRTTSHMGGESWTTRESYTLVALPRSEEILRAGALQARFTTRLAPTHEKDMTHGFVDAGLWNEMNLLGDTKSPVRRPLTAVPLPNARTHGPGAEHARAWPPQLEHAVGHAHYGYGAPAAAGVLLDGKVPPLGMLMQERAARIPSAAEQLGRGQVEALTAGSSLSSTAVRSTSPGAAARAAAPLSWAPAAGAPPSPRATMRAAEAEARRHLPPHPESAALDAFDAAHNVHDPAHWPVKVLRAKIRESGVAERVGMAPPDVLARASRAQLLAAWERVPAARRILELYGSAGQQTASEPLASHPLTAGVFSDSSRSLHGAVGVASNIVFGRTSALQHAIENEEGRWSRL